MEMALSVVLGAVWSPFKHFFHIFLHHHAVTRALQEDDILMEDFVHPLLERFSVEKALESVQQMVRWCGDKCGDKWPIKTIKTMKHQGHLGHTLAVVRLRG